MAIQAHLSSPSEGFSPSPVVLTVGISTHGYSTASYLPSSVAFPNSCRYLATLESVTNFPQSICGNHLDSLLISPNRLCLALSQRKDMAKNEASDGNVMKSAEPIQEQLFAPGNFGEVIPGQIFRSQFPQPENYAFLKSLGLKTILTIVSTEEAPGYEDWTKEQGINHILLSLPANKEAVRVQADDKVKALEIVSNKENYPLLVHCNKGKHRTGCTVGCFRRASGIHMEDVLQEYRHYAGKKVRPLDEKFISEFDLGLVTEISASIGISGEISLAAVSGTLMSTLFSPHGPVPKS
jgi:hypothetical protein